MTTVLFNLNAIVSFLCILIAVHLFWQRSFYSLAVKFLASCFLVMGLQALFLAITLSDVATGYHRMFQPLMPLLFGPLSYLMFASARDSSFSLRPLHSLHLLPPTVVLTMMATTFMLEIVDSIVLITLLGYACALLRMALRGRKQFYIENYKINTKDTETASAIYQWLLIFIGYSFLMFIFDLMIYLEIIWGTDVTKSLSLTLMISFKFGLVTFALFFALQKSPAFDWLYMPSRQAVRKPT